MRYSKISTQKFGQVAAKVIRNLTLVRQPQRLVVAISLALSPLSLADKLLEVPQSELQQKAEWVLKAKQLKAFFIEETEFKSYPEEVQKSCAYWPTGIERSFFVYGVNMDTKEAYSGNIEFRRAHDEFHLVVKRQVDGRTEWGVARFIYTMAGTDVGAEHARRKLMIKWKSGDDVFTNIYDHIYHLNFEPESMFVGRGKTFQESLIMDPLKQH